MKITGIRIPDSDLRVRSSAYEIRSRPPETCPHGSRLDRIDHSWWLKEAVCSARTQPLARCLRCECSGIPSRYKNAPAKRPWTEAVPPPSICFLCDNHEIKLAYGPWSR